MVIFRQFSTLISRGLQGMALRPWTQFFTCVAITLSALLAGVFMLFMYNVNENLLLQKGQLHFQIYWEVAASEEAVTEQWNKLSTHPRMLEFTGYTPDMALTELSERLKNDKAFTWLTGQNPLPYSASMTFLIPKNKTENEQKEWAEKILEELKALELVTSVQYNPMQMELSRSWIQMSNTIIWPLISFLAIIAGLISGNTVKLTLFARKNEIDILALVGAKDWYIKLPLIINGAILGIIGSLTSVGLLYILQRSLDTLFNIPPIYFSVDFLPLSYILLYSGAVVTVCIAGSLAATQQN